MSVSRRRPLSDYRQLKTNDLDEARAFCDRVWETHQSQPRGRLRAYDLIWHEAQFAHTRLRYLETNSALRIECAPVAHAYHVTLHERGALNHWIDGRAATSSRDRVAVHLPGQSLVLHTRPFSALLLSVDRTRMDRAMTKRFGAQWRQGSFAQDWPLQAAPVASLQSLCRYAAGEFDRPNNWLVASPAWGAALERALITLLLDSFAMSRDDVHANAGDAAPRQVRLVEDWMHANYAEAIGVEDMAEVVGVSVRALQAAFRRVRGCTPMQALAQYRLQRARSALQHAAPETTVTRVAVDCGFFHFSRFAGRYAEAFGEKPSETLLRSRQGVR